MGCGDLNQDLHIGTASTLSTEPYPQPLYHGFDMFICIHLSITECLRDIGSPLVNVLWLIRVYKHCICMMSSLISVASMILLVI